MHTAELVIEERDIRSVKVGALRKRRIFRALFLTNPDDIMSLFRCNMIERREKKNQTYIVRQTI